ncbi:MAG: DedA family protein [Methylococcus sp.]|nr:DedA family protein [Methylococcus sp.]
MDASLGIWGLFFSAFVSATLAPGGSEAVLAYLVHTGYALPAELVTVASIGNTLGSMTTWGMGWLWARRRPLDVEAIENPRQRRAVESLKRWGSGLLLMAWIPVLGDGFCFAAGWLRLSLILSVIYIAVGKALRYAVVAWLAS